MFAAAKGEARSAAFGAKENMAVVVAPPRGATLHESGRRWALGVSVRAPRCAIGNRALLRPSTFFEPPGSYGIRGISSLNVENAVFVSSETDSRHEIRNVIF